MASDAPFDPSIWIDQFKAVGGGFAGMRDTLHFCWAFPGPPVRDNVEARQLYKDVVSDPAKLSAVRDLIGGTIPEEEEP